MPGKSGTGGKGGSQTDKSQERERDPETGEYITDDDQRGANDDDRGGRKSSERKNQR